MSFSTVAATLGEALRARGYVAPTQVQAAVLEPEAAGRDLIVSAQTGSGKTVAFGLAMAPQLLDQEGRASGARAPLALIIAPTRELALQVSRELAWLYAKTGVRITSCVGGMDPSRERRNLAQGVHMVVGTPGRLRDHLERGALDLKSLRVAVLDEADEMLDLGFRQDLEEILDATPVERRTLMFSATMPPAIVALAGRYQRDAYRIATAAKAQQHGDIAYQAVAVAPVDIENVVVNLLRVHEPDAALLFCATRDNVRRLHTSLLERGFDVVALSGEHSQSERNAALQALRDGRARVCVATDVAARGIDLPGLSLVVHVELPRDLETLQHRSGRTGRAGRKGTAVLVVPYPRRRWVDMTLRAARISVEWIAPPTPEDVRRTDNERLLTTLLAPAEAEPEDGELVQRLLAERSPEQLAAALVRAHRLKLPAPEEMLDGPTGVGPQRSERPSRGFADSVWFRIDVGRRSNADPRWILPLLCRRGHITKADVGAIRIGANETLFEIPREVAERFAATVSRTAGEQSGNEPQIEPVAGTPEHPARRSRPIESKPGRPPSKPKTPVQQLRPR